MYAPERLLPGSLPENEMRPAVSPVGRLASPSSNLSCSNLPKRLYSSDSGSIGNVKPAPKA